MNRSFLCTVLLVAGALVACRPCLSADRNKAWVDAMLEARAAATQQAEGDAGLVGPVSGDDIQTVELDISGWQEVWLVTYRRSAVGIIGDPVVYDERGKKTELGSLKILAQGGYDTGPVANQIAKKKPLQIGEKTFRRGFAMPGVSYLRIETAGKYQKLAASVGAAVNRRDPLVLKVSASQPSELTAWLKIQRQYRQQSEWWYRDADWPLAWFTNSDPEDVATERQVLARRVGGCKAFGASLKETYNALLKDRVPAGDRKYLDVYAQAMAISRPAEAVYATQAAIGQLSPYGAELQTRFDEMIAEPVDVNDPSWDELAAETEQLTAAVRHLSLFNAEALRRVVADLTKTHAPTYTKGPEFLKRLAAVERRLADGATDNATIYDALKVKEDILFSNPLLQFDKLLLRKGNDPGLTSNWTSNCSRSKKKYDNEVAVLSPVRPNGKLKTLIRPDSGSFVGDIDLHWNAEKMLLTMQGDNDRWQIFEASADGKSIRQVTAGDDDFDCAEACYLPDGGIIYGSTATMKGVPCVGGSQPVANFYRMEPDGKTVRQLTFEQDQDWSPVVLDNGRVMYTRWEYTDAPHYFTRILMTMHPDGSAQMSHYGSNSFWPNSLFYARPCPDQSSRFVGVISGHHGTSRAGELILFDPALGRREADGAVQRIPGYGKEVEPIIADRLVDASWPKFLSPWPLSDKYILVSCKLNASAPWGLYLVDVFDNLQPILEDSESGYFEPVPLKTRPMPPVIPSRVDPESKDAVVFLSDVYGGPGLKGVPRGTVKQLRVMEYTYGYRNIGGHNRFGLESSWDSKRILGTVPVEKDGSAMFAVPANTPIAVQPLDEKGRALQLMRSWMVAMPGEVLSCAGCHEDQNSVTPSRSTLAGLKRPSKIEPWHGPARAFSFEHEVQPVLDRNCVGCHDGTFPERPNFADTSVGPENFSNAYHAIHGFVRRPGPESDIHMFQPMEYHASTSELVQMLERGHHGVQLDRDAWERLYCWIDMNAPYFGTWTEIAHASGNRLRDGSQIEPIAERQRELAELYVGLYENAELDAQRPVESGIEFVPPPKVEKSPREYPTLDNWPLKAADAKKLQASLGSVTKSVDLGNGLTLDLVRIPAGTFVMGDQDGDEPAVVAAVDKPFWMAATETTNALFQHFFPDHDSRYIDQWWKDHTTPGYPANGPQQPAIRISQQEAIEFCEKLSEATGQQFRLPTEVQWEWACRAGASTPFAFGDLDADFSSFANLSDESVHQFVVKGVNPKPISHQDYSAFIPHAAGVDDGQMTVCDVASYEPNAWGLYDMHGNVAEWTSSDYSDADGRVVVRGGSWRDRPQRARSGMRVPYESWQKVFNVGFRVVCED